MPPLQWDLFCRVIDNHGDLGVCWRLACDLAGRGHTVRLWVDDARALTWMAPEGAPGVTVQPWREPLPSEQPGDVVVEAFGCDPPPGFVSAMHKRTGCVWINLEYLSAEAYVERSHGLASPQFSGPGAGLTKWFYYPGFTPRTGGLLREPGLLEARAAFDAAAFFAGLGLPTEPVLTVSVFAYPNSPVQDLLGLLAGQPCRLLACPGASQQALLAAAAAFPQVQVVPLHWLSQTDYDHLLWSCDLNFVRGEDSFVRAQWAAAPWVWQIYEQQDGVHANKLDTFLKLHLRGCEPAVAQSVPQLWRAWNRLGHWPEALPPMAPWAAQTQAWCAAQSHITDLVTGVESFVAARR